MGRWSRLRSPRVQHALTLAIGMLAMLLILVALHGLNTAQQGVIRSEHRAGSHPVTVFQPQGPVPAGGWPVVVIEHGFAGSRPLMLPFALTLAHNGYVTVSFDSPGHARSPLPLHGGVRDFDASTQALVQATADVAGFARSWPDARPHLAVLGHSMASDIVIRHAMQDPQVRATVVLSAYSPQVTASSPANLLVITGSLETAMLKDEGRRMVGLATSGPVTPGQTLGRIDRGDARRLVFADGVEHISILFSREALTETVQWLDQTYGRPPRTPMVWSGASDVGLLLLGVVLLAWPLSRMLPRVWCRSAPQAVPDATAGGPAAPEARMPPARLSRRQAAFVMLTPPLLTPLLLYPLPPAVLPLLVGDYLAAFFAVYGLLTALCLVGVRRHWLLRQDASRPMPGALRSPWRIPTDPGASMPSHALVKFGLATLAVILWGLFLLGTSIDRHLFSVAPTGERLWLLPLILAGTLPWFLADEWLTRQPGASAWTWPSTKLLFLAGLSIAIVLDPMHLFFLAIIVPAMLLFFMVFGLVSRWVMARTGHPWVAAIANACVCAALITGTLPIVD